jgi:hypothetical protein
MTHRLNLLALTALLFLASGPSGKAFGVGGEDFPFFCSVAGDNSLNRKSFKVIPNPDSPTGFTMILWQRLRLRAIIPVSITESENGRYWVISGRARARLNFLLDDQVLAYVARKAGMSSHGDTQVTWHNESADSWELSPMACRNY